jgi:hypothetical protein
VALLPGAGAGTGQGGTVNITAGASGTGATGTGGVVNITSGASAATNGAGGALNLSSGAGAGSGSDGVVTISTGAVEATRYTSTGGPGSPGVTEGVLISNEANVGLTADAGSAQGDGVITSSFNVYSTVGTIGDAATLPANAAVGTRIYVKNDGANSMDVFPASGGNAGGGVDTAVAVAAGTGTMFMATSAGSPAGTWTQMYVS